MRHNQSNVAGTYDFETAVLKRMPIRKGYDHMDSLRFLIELVSTFDKDDRYIPPGLRRIYSVLLPDLNKDGRDIPPILRRIYSDLLRDPVKYHRIMTYKKPKKARRPSIDDQRIKQMSILKLKTSNHMLPTYRNACMVAYLRSEGYPLKINGRKKTAVEILSELIRRSPQSLQNDYYRHLKDIKGRESALRLGKSHIVRINALKEYVLKKKKRDKRGK